MNDHELAAALARDAGSLLVQLRSGQPISAALGKEGDRAANALLLNALSRHRPGDAILSEESVDDRSRLRARRVWIIDPLDGTNEYSQGRGDWAVHVALSIDGLPVAGAVAQPDLGRMTWTGEPLSPSAPPRAPIIVVSRSRPPRQADALANALGGTLVTMGSAGAKTMSVLHGEADLYFHEGGQSEWDNCAPAAVAQAAGLTACRIDGSPLRYNRADVSVPDLLIGHAALVREAVASLR